MESEDKADNQLKKQAIEILCYLEAIEPFVVKFFSDFEKKSLVNKLIASHILCSRKRSCSLTKIICEKLKTRKLNSYEINVLKEMIDEENIQYLIGLLQKEKNGTAKKRMVHTLGQLNTDAVDEFASLLSVRKWSINIEACQALGEMGEKAARVLDRLVFRAKKRQ